MSMGGPLLLGIDGGGTTTIAWLADATGSVLGRGRAGPSNAKAVGVEAARKALEKAIAGAFAEAERPSEPAEVACLGLAGFDRPEDRNLLETWAQSGGWGRRLILVNDGDLLLAAGTVEGWGIGLISGTGSIAVGRAPDGRAARAGGWGYVFGDEGSAYAVAVAALRWYARASDGRECGVLDSDPLAGRLQLALSIKTPPEMISAIYRPEVDRTRIAALAPVVVAAAEERSQAAGAILDTAAADLTAIASSVARKLNLPDSAGLAGIPLVLAGGFLLSSPALADAIVARLRLGGVALTSITPVPDPVFGALTLARRALDNAIETDT
jgi:N-acetylglucosamine kinase-like BadF-type ATPase